MRKRPIEFLAILYMVAWTISPPLQLDMNYRFLALGCAGVLLLKNGFAMRQRHVIALLFCLLVAVNAVIRFGSMKSALSQIGIYMLFIGYVMNYWYWSDWDDFTWIVPITLLCLTVWNFQTITALVTNPSIARMLVRNDDMLYIYMRQGVGGYALIYSQVIICPAIISWILCTFRRNKLFFVCGMIWVVTFVCLLGGAGYTIAIVASFLGIVVFFMYKRRSIAPALILSMVALCMVVVLIGYLDGFRNFLLDVFDGTKVASKITDITATLTTDETADSIFSRASLYMVSIRSIFVDYPLIGGWWNGGAGGHSAMLDAFAQYGVFGGMVMYRMLYCVPSIWKRYRLSSTTLRTVNATIITITSVVWLNTVPYNFSMMLMVVLPIILTNIEDWSTKDEYLMDSKLNSD